MKESFLRMLGIPESFGVTFLLLGLVLALAPWLAGHDFGFLKIPTFSPQINRALRIVGPLVLAVALLAHVPIHEPARMGCSLSGRVFDPESAQALPGVFVGFDRYAEDQRHSKEVKFNVATTGIDGSFRATCDGIDGSEFPLVIKLSHSNWKAQHITAQKVQAGDARTDLNFPLTIRKGDLRFPPLEVKPRIPPRAFGKVVRIDTGGGNPAHDFRSGVTDSGPVQGDFYFSPGPPAFWANNRGQRGLVDLGPIDDSLDKVAPPDTGYYQYGVPAIVGHVYASLSRAGGEDGHIVFRVLDIGGTGNNIDRYELQYFYRKRS